MSCPNCSHTMESVGGGIFWCPRCGTQKGDSGMVWTPKLVERCRDFEKAMGFLPLDCYQTAWRNLRVPESINVPEKRPMEGA